MPKKTKEGFKMIQLTLRKILTNTCSPLIPLSINQQTQALISACFDQKCHQFTAHQKVGAPNLLGKVTGYEADPEKRKEITNALKGLGLRWKQDTKSWEPTAAVEFQKVCDLIHQPIQNDRSSIASMESKPSEYETRIESLLKEWEGRLSALLPKHVSKERFLESLRIALFQARRTGEKSTDQALFTACSQCAQIGLTPSSLNEVYFSTRDNQIEFLLGYKGIISLASRAIPGLVVESNVVYEGDVFEYTLGTEARLTHTRSDEEVPEKITHGYVILTFPDGTRKITVIDQEHVEKRKSCSKGVNAPSSPWNKFPREMWLKTAVRDTFRFVSLSDNRSGEVERDFMLKLQHALKEEIDQLSAGNENENVRSV